MNETSDEDQQQQQQIFCEEISSKTRNKNVPCVWNAIH